MCSFVFYLYLLGLSSFQTRLGNLVDGVMWQRQSCLGGMADTRNPDELNPSGCCCRIAQNRTESSLGRVREGRKYCSLSCTGQRSFQFLSPPRPEEADENLTGLMTLRAVLRNSIFLTLTPHQPSILTPCAILSMYVYDRARRSNRARKSDREARASKPSRHNNDVNDRLDFSTSSSEYVVPLLIFHCNSV